MWLEFVVASYMKPYVVRPGDYLVKIAYAKRFDPAEVWNHPKNADLAARRQPEILAPGDILYIPAQSGEDDLNGAISIHSEQSNTFEAEVPEVPVRLILTDSKGKPLRNEPFEVDVPNPPDDLSTKEDGTATFHVPVTTDVVILTLTNRALSLEVHVGHLDPLENPEKGLSGLCGRLANLGHFVVGEDVELEDAGPQISAAIRSFQDRHGLQRTGVLDERTAAAIKKAHGS